jgi:hypothetical protein
MRALFLADADLNNKIVTGLRRREHAVDFLNSSEGGVIHRPDADVLKIAADAGRVLVSHDRNTMLKHFERFIENATSPGLIIIAQDVEIGLAIDQLLLVWAVVEAEELQNSRMFLPI